MQIARNYKIIRIFVLEKLQQKIKINYHSFK